MTSVCMLKINHNAAYMKQNVMSLQLHCLRLCYYYSKTKHSGQDNMVRKRELFFHCICNRRWIRLKIIQIPTQRKSYYVGNYSSLNHTNLSLKLGKKEIYGKLLLKISWITAYSTVDAKTIHARQALRIGRIL